MLLEYGADIQIKDSYGNSPLHLSCLSHDLKMVFLLLSMDCDPNQHNSRGETPLMVVMNDPSPSLEILRLLISMGADVSVTNPFTGDNSLHVISSKRSVATKALFLLYTATPSATKALEMKNNDGKTPAQVNS